MSNGEKRMIGRQPNGYHDRAGTSSLRSVPVADGYGFPDLCSPDGTRRTASGRVWRTVGVLLILAAGVFVGWADWRWPEAGVFRWVVLAGYLVLLATQAEMRKHLTAHDRHVKALSDHLKAADVRGDMLRAEIDALKRNMSFLHNQLKTHKHHIDGGNQ